MDTSETPPVDDPTTPPVDDPTTTINGPDLSSSPSSTTSSDDDDDSNVLELRTENCALIAELQELRASYESSQSKMAAMEENLGVVEREKEEALWLNLDLNKKIKEVSSERDSVRDEINGIRVCLVEREDEVGKKMEEVRSEVEDFKERIEKLENERREIVRAFTDNLGLVRTAEEGLARMIESVEEEKVGNFSDAEKEEGTMGAELGLDEELRVFLEEVMGVSKLASVAETKVSEYQEMRKKEKRELENSVVSLTEENRDINSLLRIALVEKETVEKSLNKLKGNNDPKRVALLQIAERGLQRVGFGFMMGGASNELSLDNSGTATSSSKSDSSECEEEVVSLVMYLITL